MIDSEVVATAAATVGALFSTTSVGLSIGFEVIIGSSMTTAGISSSMVERIAKPVHAAQSPAEGVSSTS